VGIDQVGIKEAFDLLDTFEVPFNQGDTFEVPFNQGDTVEAFNQEDIVKAFNLEDIVRASNHTTQEDIKVAFIRVGTVEDIVQEDTDQGAFDLIDIVLVAFSLVDIEEAFNLEDTVVGISLVDTNLEDIIPY